jgi:hypothetical protein
MELITKGNNCTQILCFENLVPKNNDFKLPSLAISIHAYSHTCMHANTHKAKAFPLSIYMTVSKQSSSSYKQDKKMT